MPIACQPNHPEYFSLMQLKVTVIGLGYLGATTAVAFAKMGHSVLGIDPDIEKVKSLQNGKVPFHEIGLEQALQECQSEGIIRFATEHDAQSYEADIHFLCVGTPQSKVGFATDTTYLFQAIDSLLPVMNKNSVIVGKSTVPVGTAQSLIEYIQAHTGVEAKLAWNPEFLQEGSALEDSIRPNRIVIGAQNDLTIETIKNFYRPQIEAGIPVVETDLQTAELVKVAANSFLATKISFINMIAEVAEVAGADTSKLAKAIGYDDRIGSKFLKNGIGYGGGCLPKDLRSFIARSRELGLDQSVSFLEDVEAINNRRRLRPLEIANEYFGRLFGKKVLILGATFKPDTDDIRNSPSLEVAELFASAGAVVSVHDPLALDKVAKNYPTLRIQPDLNLALAENEVVVLGTEWSEYRNYDPSKISAQTNGRLLIDGRNALDLEAWRECGWQAVALGRSTVERAKELVAPRAVA